MRRLQHSKCLSMMKATSFITLSARAIESMVSHGVWDAIVERVDSAGFAEAAREYSGVLEELRASERKELHNALTGEGYQSLWER